MKYNDEVRYWLNEIDDAKRREKDFRENGEKINSLYNGEKKDEYPYNIIYSNTETLSPALYSQPPRPKVKERFPEKDNKGFTKINPLTKAVTEASNCMLSYLIDTNLNGHDSFHSAMQACVLDALLPGRGVTTINFDAESDDDEVEWASVVASTKKYNRVYFGFATKWENMPWVAYEEYIDEEEALEKFGDVAKQIKYTVSEEDEESNSEYEEGRRTACFYQIWSKEEKEIIWISNAHDEVLKKQEDPLGITGFFNTPKPLMLHRKSNDLNPTPLYALYENQARELNRLTRSINKVAMAIKVRGGYDGSLGELMGRILDEEDNSLVPIENMSGMIDGGFEKRIWILPLGELMSVLQQLYQSREACKQVIYEITGISDILRGSSKASETLGAQKVKEAWGTMRLKNFQGEVQNYVRDLLRIMLDVAVENIPQRLWIKITGLPYPTKEQKEKSLKLLEEKVKPQIQEAMQAGDKNHLKKLQQQMEELTTILKQPSWENILEQLGDDYIRSFKVDIETNSTLDTEATEDKKNIAEMMNAMSQFMNGLMPMVQNEILPFGAAKSMLLDIVKRFRFGEEVENEINMMTPPKNQEQAKKQMEQAKKQIEQEKQKIVQEKQKLEQGEKRFQEEQKRVGDALDKQVTDLARDKMQLDYDKKIFAMSQDLAKEKMKNMDDAMENDLTTKAIKAEVSMQKKLDATERAIQKMVDKYERSNQSMADKQLENYKKTAEQLQSVETSPQNRKKVVKLIYDDDGKPIGANVEEKDEEANGDIEFTYNEEGKPDGAVVN